MIRSPWVLKFATLAIMALFAGNASAAAAPSIIPLPKTMTVGTGTLTFAASEVVPIYADAATTGDSTVPWVIKLLKNIKMSSTMVATAAAAKIAITKVADGTLGAEGYKLSVTATQVTITAPTFTGQFYAIQTLRQMFPAGIEDSTSGIVGPVTLTTVDITDVPRFEHRGYMLDPVRKFCPLPYLYQHVDRMALYKCNRLHMLISNDQGFRVESLVYPLLTSKGAATNCGGQTPPAGTRWYYTQTEMKALVLYAAKRHVQIFPEIDMPGHCTAMCYCYPLLGSPNGAIQTSEEVGLSIMNTTPYVFTFCSALWREMATIFPWHQVQTGGDECSNMTQAVLKTTALRFQDSLRVIGKDAICWDEISACGGLASGNWSQDWHSGLASGQVVSTCNYLYFDHPNKTGDASTNNWCVNQVPLASVYGTPLNVATLKGLEPTLFTERVNIYPDYWDRQSWPRQCAVADIGWAANNNDYNGFVTRLLPHGSRFATMGIKYYTAQSPALAWPTTTVNTKLTNLYDNYIPVMPPVGVRQVAYSSHRTPLFFASDSYKIYNLSGRVVGVSNSEQGVKQAIKTMHGTYVVQNNLGNARTLIK
jgi:hexosaminidase